MQHDGWLETLLHSRFPKHDLVVPQPRLLRRRGGRFTDKPIQQRLAPPTSAAPTTGSTRTKTDVVFAFFGYNESFAGEDGLDKFKKDLDDFIKHTLGQKYNGKSAAAPGPLLAHRP